MTHMADIVLGNEIINILFQSTGIIFLQVILKNNGFRDLLHNSGT